MIGDDCLIAWWTWLSNPAAIKLLYPVQEFCLNVYWFVALLSWLIVAVHWMLFIRLLEVELDALLIIPKGFLKKQNVELPLFILMLFMLLAKYYAGCVFKCEFVWMLLLMLHVTLHKPCCRNPRASSHMVLLAVVVLCCMNVLYVTMLACTILLKFIGHDVWLKLSIWVALLLYYAKP